jgi:hypothetical protein
VYINVPLVQEVSMCHTKQDIVDLAKVCAEIGRDATEHCMGGMPENFMVMAGMITTSLLTRSLDDPSFSAILMSEPPAQE